MLVTRLRPGSGVADLALLSGKSAVSSLPCHPCPHDANARYTQLVNSHVDLLLIFIPQEARESLQFRILVF